MSGMTREVMHFLAYGMNAASKDGDNVFDSAQVCGPTSRMGTDKAHATNVQKIFHGGSQWSPSRF